MTVTVLAGGVGSARFLAGLVRVVPPDDLTVVGNIGDDERIRGLHVSPDVDSVLYHLAGLTDWDRGWGMDDERYTANDRYRDLAARLDDLGVDLQDWFILGDRDLATHMLRTRMLEAGRPLSEATDALRRALGIGCRVLPASDDPVRTKVRASSGDLLDFQDYFVRRGQDVEVTGVEFAGTDEATPAPGVLEALREADVVVVPPSNPLLSVDPVLAVPGVRDAVSEGEAPVVAVSPIIGGRAVKGPLAGLMEGLDLEVSPVGVAELYRELVDVFVLDITDEARSADVEALGMRAVALDTLMRSPEDAVRLAKAVLDAK